jgi:hypothetical protein
MPTASLKLLPMILFIFDAFFGVSTNSEQKIPVKRTIKKMDETHFIFILMVPFFFVLSWRS